MTLSSTSDLLSPGESPLADKSDMVHKLEVPPRANKETVGLLFD